MLVSKISTHTEVAKVPRVFKKMHVWWIVYFTFQRNLVNVPLGPTVV